MNNKISIVVVTYNHERYIREALDSIVNQEFDCDIEVLVGDDCSIDKTREILLEYQNSYPEIFKLFLRENNLGATRNLYDLLRRASGNYIAILEGDDYWSNNHKLKIQKDFLEKNKEYIASGYNVVMFNEKRNNMGYWYYNSEEEIISIEDLISNIESEKKQILHIQSLVFRNIFNDDKYKEVMIDSDFIADISLNFALLDNGKIHIRKDIEGDYRYITSKTSSYSSLGIQMRLNSAKLEWEGINKFTEGKYKEYIDNIINKRVALTVMENYYQYGIKALILTYKNLSKAQKGIANQMIKNKFRKKLGLVNR